MENGKDALIFCDIQEAGAYLKTSYNTDKKVGIWGVHQGLNIAHKQVYNRVRAMSDVVVGIYYQNWASWINYVCGGCQYTDADYNSDITSDLYKMCDVVIVFGGDYNIFDGRHGYYLRDLWPVMLDQYPDWKLSKYITGVGRENLYSHFRACQALKIVQNDFIPCHVSAGGKRDAWRWDFKKWQEENYGYTYEMLEPVLDQYGNSISGSKQNLGITIDFPLLLPSLNGDEVAERAAEYGIKTHYCFVLCGYIYAKFSYNGKVWVEAIKDA